MGKLWLRKTAFGLGIIGPIVAIAAGAFYFSPERLALKKCDTAIQATLKAPSTFRRISSSGTGTDGMYLFNISYDAANGFGVPIRGQGWCSISSSGAPATWFEPPQI